MIKLTKHKVGFCCHSKTLGDKGKFKTVRISSIKDLPSVNQVEIVKSRAIHNLQNTLEIIKWCIKNNIQLYRISSDIIPLSNYIEKFWNWSEDNDIKVLCSKISMLTTVSGIRTSMHPSAYCVINNPHNSDVFEKTAFPILEYHHTLSDMLGCKTLVIHVGGVYGDKQLAMDKFVDNFNRLPRMMREKLRIENDKSYNIEEVLDLCNRVSAPALLDYHHHRCNPCDTPLELIVDDIKSTWGTETPKLHLSTGKSNKMDYAHADYIDQSDYDEVMMLTNGCFDIAIEAKAKDLAVLALDL